MSRTRQGLLMLLLAVGISALLTWLAIASNPVITDGLAVALRWTGRFAFLVFLLPLCASPLHKLRPSTLSQRLVRWRRNAGITFGGMQAAHLLIIVALLQASDSNPFDLATLIVGGLGLGLAIAMMLTSFDLPARWLGPRLWKITHRAGLYVATFIYFFDFLIVPFELGFPPVYWPFTALTALALLLRGAAALASDARGKNAATVSGQAIASRAQLKN